MLILLFQSLIHMCLYLIKENFHLKSRSNLKHNEWILKQYFNNQKHLFAGFYLNYWFTQYFFLREEVIKKKYKLYIAIEDLSDI